MGATHTRTISTVKQIITPDGRVVERQQEQKGYFKSDERPFVKVYLDDVKHLFNTTAKSMRLLFELSKTVNYCSPNNEEGGNIVSITKHKKDTICKALGWKDQTFRAHLSDLVKSQLLFKIGPGDYQINPFIIARGGWEDIQSLRLTIEYDVENGTFLRKAISTQESSFDEDITFQDAVEEYLSDEATDTVDDIITKKLRKDELRAQMSHEDEDAYYGRLEDIGYPVGL